MGHTMFLSVCYRQENLVASRMLPVRGELDLKFRAFSHRDPVAQEGRPKPPTEASM